MVLLVREAGGFGDVICVGAAALAVKREWPEEEVMVCLPEEFVRVGECLEGIDRVISLGTLNTIRLYRRRRDAPFDPITQPYLRPLLDFPGARLVDQYCPGYLHESSCSGPLQYNRSQLFAMATGARCILDARPRWKEFTGAFVDTEVLTARRPLIAFQPRGTCRARSFTPSFKRELLEELVKRGTVLYLDCILPERGLPESVVPLIGYPIPEVAEAVRVCDLAVSVDSFLLHLSAALEVPAVGVFGPTDGANTVRSYPDHVALDGSGGKCRLPCNYNPDKGWTAKCRSEGCPRMLSHSVESVISLVDKQLQKRFASACFTPVLPL